MAKAQSLFAAAVLFLATTAGHGQDTQVPQVALPDRKDQANGPPTPPPDSPHQSRGTPAAGAGTVTADIVKTANAEVVSDADAQKDDAKEDAAAPAEAPPPRLAVPPVNAAPSTCCGGTTDRHPGHAHRLLAWLTYRPLSRPGWCDCCHPCVPCCLPLYAYFPCPGLGCFTPDNAAAPPCIEYAHLFRLRHQLFGCHKKDHEAAPDP